MIRLFSQRVAFRFLAISITFVVAIIALSLSQSAASSGAGGAARVSSAAVEPPSGVFYTVTGTADNTDAVIHGGTGTAGDPFQMSSLRGAVLNGNTVITGSLGPVTIFVPAGTYPLSVDNPNTPATTGTINFPDLEIGSGANRNTSIVGTGGTPTIQQTISGNDVITTGFDSDGFTPIAVTLTLQNLAVTGGTFSGIFTGVDNTSGRSSTTLINCNVHDNSDPFFPGGGIFNQTGDLTIQGSTFANNTASAQGGAIFFDLPNSNGSPGTFGSLIVTDSTFTNNTASASNNVGGGAIAFFAPNRVENTYSITGSTFTNNHATGTASKGGAIGSGGAGTLNVNLSRFFGNTSTGLGTAVAGQGAAPVNAVNNWWGCDDFPGSAGCDTVNGTGITSNPRLDLVLTSVAGCNSTALTADFSKNSANQSVAPTVLNGLTVNFAVVSGPAGSMVSPTSATISGFMASSNLTATTGGTATVSATLDNGTQNASAEIDEAVAVATNPSDQAVCDGGTATFMATASGNPAPTVQWQVSTNGGGLFSDIPGETNPILSFTATAAQNGNQYRAVFTNMCESTTNTATTTSATLTVNTAPTVATNPTNQTVCEGAMASFTAAAGGSASTVQWQVSTNGGGSFSDIPGATSGTLSFTASASQSGNQYRAVFTNACGTATTTAATLTVNTGSVVTTNPSNQTLCEGGTASFTAAASGSPAPTVQWQVSTNGGGSFSDISGATNTTLSFTTTASQSGNQYRAVFTNACSTATTSAATLTVNTAPVVTANPVSQTVTSGNVTFTAAASGSPTPTVRWQVSTNGGASFSDIPGATSTSLTFATDPSQDGNQYRAVFTNVCGTATTTAATLTTCTPPAVTGNPSSVADACVGQVVSFTASASGSPTPTVQWQVSTNGGGSFSDISGATSTTLMVTASVSVRNNQYRAVFTNACGTATTSAATLGVDTIAPVITLNGQTIELWPPNHQYHTVNLTDLVASATDNCNGNLLSSVVIASVSSDEPEENPNGGDGNTLNDIVIAPDCKSVQLRAERDGNLNGRVYTITFKVTDSAGNVGTATAKVSVPHSQNGTPAVDEGPAHGYTVTSSCP